MFKQLSLFILVSLMWQAVFAVNVNQTEVIIETNLGSFTMELYPEKAPETVANFLTYVNEGFYDNTLFHRVMPGFVVQGGGFEKGMVRKQTHTPVKNESGNGLKNVRGTISMARRTHPDTATSQFYINLMNNYKLDWKAEYQPGYTVFGKVTEGMEVIDKIAMTPTHTLDRFNDVPKEDVIIQSIKRTGGGDEADVSAKQQEFIEGEHYVVLDKPVATRDSSKIEVVELFSYGCPHCYEFEPLIKGWSKQQGGDVDFWFFPAVWNNPMKLYARAFYTAHVLNVAELIHVPLFTAIVIEQRSIKNKADLADFFAAYGVDKQAFTKAFDSTEVDKQVKLAEARVRSYKPAGAPEIIVNGKYRIDRMRAGGIAEMLVVADYLVDKERTRMKKVK